MKLLLSGMLLASLCALSSWSVSSDIPVVTQTPDVSVTEGEAVNITCCWTGKFERMSVNWLKNQTKIQTELLNTLNNSEGSLQKEKYGCSYLTFMHITREDSGRYTCSLYVEIPISFNTYDGNGTVITVTARDNDNNKDNNASGDDQPDALRVPMIVTLAVMVPLLLITLACFCALKRRQALSAARVIYEVPHIDSEEADMDKRSTSSSTGSSQWCQVPVYESFDYFERVQTKESG